MVGKIDGKKIRAVNSVTIKKSRINCRNSDYAEPVEYVGELKIEPTTQGWGSLGVSWTSVAKDKDGNEYGGVEAWQVGIEELFGEGVEVWMDCAVWNEKETESRREEIRIV